MDQEVVLGAEPVPDNESWTLRRAPTLIADRLGMTPRGVMGALLAVIASGVGGWWALRPPPPPAEDVVPLISDVAPVVTTTTVEQPLMVVHVGGAVHHAGLHELRPGARVGDAIDAAGGLTDAADLRQLNLAQVVSDGQRIWVPEAGEEISVVTGEGFGASDLSGGPMSLSSASSDQLQDLPGIGPSLAAAIIEHRSSEGGFSSVDELLEVSGIGPAKLEGLRDLVVP